MVFRRDNASARRIIRLPKVTLKNAPQAHWSDTFFWTLLRRANGDDLTEDEARKMDNPPDMA